MVRELRDASPFMRGIAPSGLLLLCGLAFVACSSSDCPTGQVRCGDACVDTASDAFHCGSCGHACPAPRDGLAACTEGICGGACPGGQPLCEDACVDFRSNPDHCGGCGRACPRPPGGSASCVASACGASCEAGLAACGLDCVDTGTDLDHCGGCDAACTAPSGGTAQCVSGQCNRTCPNGKKLCGDACVDVTTDIAHCGACDAACVAPTGGAVKCEASACVPACPRGFTNCGDSCRNLFSDISHCGSCGHACEAPAGGSTACVQRVCRNVCPDGLTICNGRCVDLANDPLHCGACDEECSVPLDGVATCARGTCGGRCPLGTELCAGACRNLLLDPGHCGTCGHACPIPAGGAALCVEGSCKEQCGDGELSCDLACVDVGTDPEHCGTCEISCPAPNGGSSSCSAGRCRELCPDGLALCGPSCIDTTDNDDHCGRCWLSCGALAFCDGGRCIPRPPELDDVTPSRAATQARQVLLASGSVFTRPLEASLVRGGQRIVLEETLSSTRQIRARLPAAMPAGTWDFEVRTPGGIARLPGAVVVSDAPVRIEFPDVGRGDAMLVTSSSGDVLVVDGGPAGSGAQLRTMLNGRRPSHIVVTTFAPEHLDGIVELMRGPDRRIGTADDVLPQVALIDHGDNHACTTASCLAYFEVRGKLAGRGLLKEARPGDEIDLGDVRATVLAANGSVLGGRTIPTATVAEHGLALLVEAAGLRLLTTADLPAGKLSGCASSSGTAALEQVVARAAGRVDVWKVGAHGDCSAGDPASFGTVLPWLVVATPGEASCEPSERLVRSIENLGGTLALTTPGRFASGSGCPAGPSSPRTGSIDIEIAPSGERRVLVGGAALDAPQGAPWLARVPGPKVWVNEGGSQVLPISAAVDPLAPLSLRLIDRSRVPRIALLPWERTTDAAIAAFDARGPVPGEIATSQAVEGDRLLLTPAMALQPDAGYALLVGGTNETTRVLTFATTPAVVTESRILRWSARAEVPADLERLDLYLSGPVAAPPAGAVVLEDALDGSDAVTPELVFDPPLLRMRLPAVSRVVNGTACGPLCPGRTYALRTTAKLTSPSGVPVPVPSEWTFRVSSCTGSHEPRIAPEVSRVASSVRFDATVGSPVAMVAEVAPEAEFEALCAAQSPRCRTAYTTGFCAVSVGCGPPACRLTVSVGYTEPGLHRWRLRGVDRAGRLIPTVEGTFDATAVGPLLTVTELHAADDSGLPPFLELANAGDAPVPLSGLTLRRSNEDLLLIPRGTGSELAPRARAVVVADEAAVADLALTSETTVLLSGAAPVVRSGSTFVETSILRGASLLTRTAAYGSCASGESVEREPPGQHPNDGRCTWASPGVAPSESR